MSEQPYTQTHIPAKVTPGEAGQVGPASVAPAAKVTPTTVHRVRRSVLVGATALATSALVVGLLVALLSDKTPVKREQASTPMRLPEEGEVKPPEEVTSPRVRDYEAEAAAQREAAVAPPVAPQAGSLEALDAQVETGGVPPTAPPQGTAPGQPGAPTPKSIWAQAAENHERQISQNFYQDKISARRTGLRVQLEQAPDTRQASMAQPALEAGQPMQPVSPQELALHAAHMQAAQQPMQAGAGPSPDAVTQREGWQRAPREAGGLRQVVGVATARAGVLRAGTMLELVLETAINSELPGMLRARLVRPVEDPTGRVLLEAGTMFLGEYNARVEAGSERVQLVWTRAITPAGMSYALGAIPGTDLAGASGSAADVDRHWGELVGGALVSSLLSGGQALAQGNTTALVQTPRQAFSQGVFAAGQDTTRQVTQRDVQRSPVLRVEAGAHLAALVHADLHLVGGMP